MESTPEPDSWLAHAASGVLCIAGAWFLAHRAQNVQTVSSSAAAATAGVGLGCVLYLLGFQAIVGGWFLLYQAPTPPNFIPQAERQFLAYAAVLIYLQLVTRQRVVA
jgi:predicted small integral membrane protein